MALSLFCRRITYIPILAFRTEIRRRSNCCIPGVACGRVANVSGLMKVIASKATYFGLLVLMQNFWPCETLTGLSEAALGMCEMNKV